MTGVQPYKSEGSLFGVNAMVKRPCRREGRGGVCSWLWGCESTRSLHGLFSTCRHRGNWQRITSELTGYESDGTVWGSARATRAAATAARCLRMERMAWHGLRKLLPLFCMRWWSCYIFNFFFLPFVFFFFFRCLKQWALQPVHFLLWRSNVPKGFKKWYKTSLTLLSCQENLSFCS